MVKIETKKIKCYKTNNFQMKNHLKNKKNPHSENQPILSETLLKDIDLFVQL